MPCSQLSIDSSLCGSHGECVNASQPSESYCECNDGWSQSAELNFFNEGDSLSSSVCYYNSVVLTTLYSIQATLIFWAILSSFYLQWKARVLLMDRAHFLKVYQRMTPLYIFWVLGLSAALYRLFAPDTALFCEDPLFSFLIANSLGAIDVYTVVLLNKYIRYLQAKVAGFRGSSPTGSNGISCCTSSFFVVALSKVNNGMVVYDIIKAQIFWSCALFESNETSLFLFRIGLGSYIFRNVYNIFVFGFLFSNVIRDMEQLHVARGGEVKSYVVDLQGLNKWLRRALPKIKASRLSIIINCTLNGSFQLLCLVIDGLIQAWTYIIPGVFIVIIMVNIVFFRMDLNKVHGNSSARSKTKQEEPATSASTWLKDSYGNAAESNGSPEL